MRMTSVAFTIVVTLGVLRQTHGFQASDLELVLNLPAMGSTDAISGYIIPKLPNPYNQYKGVLFASQDGASWWDKTHAANGELGAVTASDVTAQSTMSPLNAGIPVDEQGHFSTSNWVGAPSDANVPFFAFYVLPAAYDMSTFHDPSGGPIPQAIVSASVMASTKQRPDTAAGVASVSPRAGSGGSQAGLDPTVVGTAAAVLVSVVVGLVRT